MRGLLGRKKEGSELLHIVNLKIYAKNNEKDMVRFAD